MQQIKTDDGSITFKSKDVDETYHSTSGAKEESVKKFVEPCLGLIDGKSESEDSINVLDICFGLGYNTAALLERFSGNINVIALENDPEILLKILEIDEEMFSKYWIIKELIRKNADTIRNITKNKENDNKENINNETSTSNKITITEDNIRITLIIDDARESIKQVKDEFDLCFLDPFSPKKMPELWSYEFLKDIYDKMKSDSIITTYSCARIVRDNLSKAGFDVKDGPCIGRRAPSTIGRKQAAINTACD